MSSPIDPPGHLHIKCRVVPFSLFFFLFSVCPIQKRGRLILIGNAILLQSRIPSQSCFGLPFDCDIRLLLQTTMRTIFPGHCRSRGTWFYEHQLQAYLLLYGTESSHTTRKIVTISVQENVQTLMRTSTLPSGYQVKFDSFSFLQLQLSLPISSLDWRRFY